MGLIYKIQNKNDGKIYIGQTSSTLKSRLAKHNEVINTSNCHIHRAVKKYGWDAFEISIVEDHIPNELLNEREIYWIDFYNSFELGYNMNRGGNGRVIKEQEVLDLWYAGSTITDITNLLPTKKDTVRQILHEAGITTEQIQSRKHIHKDPNVDIATIIKLWNDGKTTREIRSLCGDISQGYLLKKLDEAGITREERAKRQHKTKEVHQYSIDGEYIQSFDSARLAGEQLNLNPHQIRATCTGKQKTCGGYKWTY